MERKYFCIDLKSFYASVECVERGLDPMKTNLVVADPERTDKTICLAVSPAMKKAGVRNRCRVFEIPKSIDYIQAPPRMQKYIDYSAEIYGIYLKYVSKDDIHVYSIDEAFLDVTHYLKLYGKTPVELAKTILKDIYDTLGIRASCGIGTNLYLTKIALDITAKHSEDFIGELDEESFKKTLWNHTPLTDFWRIGQGTAKKLAYYGIYSMGDIARTSEDFLYRTFGVDAELLIDHAYGRESVTIEDIKKYNTKSKSLTSGQVLMCDYNFDDGELIVKEMMDLLCLDMVNKNLVSSSITLYVGYSNALDVPPARGTASLATATNSDILMLPAISNLYRRIVNPLYPVRRITIICNQVEKESDVQLNLFDNFQRVDKNRKIQKAIIEIKYKYGKNAILKGMNYIPNAMTIERNNQIGGHKSG